MGLFRSHHQLKVDAFMRQAGQSLPSRPQTPPEEVRELRARLLFEEALETISALGFDLVARRSVDEPPDLCNLHNADACDRVEMIPNDAVDLPLIVDGCCDLAVVTTGTLSACGVDGALVQMEVDRNNLEKFGDGHQLRADGKLVKPPGHKPPAIADELKRQGWDGRS